MVQGLCIGAAAIAAAIPPSFQNVLPKLFLGAGALQTAQIAEKIVGRGRDEHAGSSAPALSLTIIKSCGEDFHFLKVQPKN